VTWMSRSGWPSKTGAGHPHRPDNVFASQCHTVIPPLLRCPTLSIHRHSSFYRTLRFPPLFTPPHLLKAPRTSTVLPGRFPSPESPRWPRQFLCSSSASPLAVPRPLSPSLPYPRRPGLTETSTAPPKPGATLQLDKVEPPPRSDVSKALYCQGTDARHRSTLQLPKGGQHGRRSRVSE